MKSNEKPILRLAFLTPVLLAPLHGDVTADDDGSVGSPFLSTSANAPAWGGSVTANDSGTIVAPATGRVMSAENARVTLLADGTFLYDPTSSAAARDLASGGTLTDTFDYTLVLGEVVTEANQVLDATATVNSFGFTGLPSIVPATGTSLPPSITSAHEFDGSGGADRGSFDGSSTQDVTLEFWFKPDDVASNQIILETGGSGDGSGFFLKSDGTLFWLIKDGSASVNVGTGAIAAGEWIHVVLTHDVNASDPNDETKIYINGTLAGSDATPTDVNDWSGSDGAGLGHQGSSAVGGATATADPSPSVSTYGNFDGQIGVIRFYQNRVLSASEANANYLHALVVDDTGTVTVEVSGVDDAPDATDDLIAGPLSDSTLVSTADLTANDGAARTAPPANFGSLILNYDANYSSGSSVWENLGPVGGTALDLNLGSGVTHSPSVVSSVSSIRAAYSFDGTVNASGTYGTGTGNDAIHELLPGVDSNDATFEFWAKPANTSQVMTLFETGGGTGIGMVIDNGVLEAAMELDASTQSGSYVSYDLVADPLGLVGGDPTTDFNHYAAVARVGNSGMSLYVNGVLVDNTTSGNGSDWDGGDGFGLGRFGGNNHGGFANSAGGGTYDAPFLGEIASFRLYGAALNADQVERNYQAATNLLLVNYEAWAPGNDNDTWQNTGPVAGTALDWRLGGGVTLDGSPGSSRAQLTAAYDFDGTTDAFAVYGLSEGTDSLEDVVGDAIELQDVTVEAWVKLDVADQTQFATIFDGGATQGLGLVIDNEVLIAATETDGATLSGSTVSYDLDTDSLGVLGGQTTINEFFQVAVSVEVGGGLALFVNGVEVDSSSGGVVDTDWVGGDGDGLGHFAGDGHGGFANPAGGGAYDTYFNGSIAAFRIYGEALGEADVLQSFRAIADDTDIEGNTLSVTGIFDDATGVLKTVSQTADLDSGATVTLDSATGAFTYDPNGAFDDLVADEVGYDRFTYQVTSASGTGTAQVVVAVTGHNTAVPDTLEATELLVTNFAANQIVGNDEHALGTGGAYLNVNANDVTPADLLAGVWRNTGRGGSTYNVNMSSGSLIAPPVLESNFGAVGQSWENPVGTFTSFQPISDNDATVEIWFQPTPLTTGRQMLMESGGSGNGMAIVYNADTAEVDFIIDGGDDTNNNIQVSATGIVPGEFNQLIAIYDKDSPTVEDTLTLYLNGDPVAFSGVADASDTNAGGTTNNFSGSDGSGIGAKNASEALQNSFGLPGFPPGASAAFEGQISIVRVYDRKLSIAEVEANFDAIAQVIQSFTGTGGPGSSVTTTLGATVTLNADGSFDYDSAGLADIPEGNVVMDTFDYTISDGAGGTTTATVTVNVTGVGNFLAVDDNFGVNESDGPTVFDPVANDLGADAVVVELQSDVSNFATNIPTGTVNGETADFRDGSNHGWQFLWNAPTGWTSGGSFDGTTGALGSEADYLPLVWDATVGGWLVDDDGVDSNATAEPGAYLRISPDGTGIPGLGSTQNTAGNDKDRCLILAYTVDSDGYYGITGSTISVPSGSSGGISVETLVGPAAINSTPVAGGATASFDQLLGFANADDTIYIAISPSGSRSSDYFADLDFTIVKLPSADSQLNDILGTVTTDGSTITYDPGTVFNGLAAGQTVDETITYTIRDLSSTLDYDGGTVAFAVGQTVTSSSGGSAEILSISGDATSGTLRLGVISGTINDNDTLAGGGGGAALANGTPVASTSVSTAEFTVTVTGENDAPTANADPLAANADEDTGVTGALSVLINDTDPDQGDSLTLVVSEVQSTTVSGPTVVATDKGGSLTMYPDGTFDYVPPVTFNPLAVGETDTDTFTYLCEDSGGLPAPAAVLATITIIGANDPVTATANDYAVDLDASVSGNVITDDTGSGVDSSVDTNDTLSVSDIDTSATKGFVNLQSDGSFFYDPGCAFETLAPGATDTDTFVYTLDDSQGATDTATVTVTVTGVNQPADVPDAASLAQVVIGTGNQALGDIVVLDTDSNRSTVVAGSEPLFRYKDNVAVFSDGRPNGDADMDLDSDTGGSTLNAGAGFSVELGFLPQTADLTGTVVVFEVGGSSNGSAILLVDGIPHLLSKAGSGSGSEPTDDNPGDNVFQDLDWLGDSVVVVPLSTVPVLPGGFNELAVVYDISNDTVKYSLNGAPEGTATLLNNDSVNWYGDHTTNIGKGAGSGVGGNTNSGTGPFRDSNISNPAGGVSAVPCVNFWNEATGSAAGVATESLTATLTIQSWNGSDSLSGLSNDGGGVFSVSGSAAAVNAALAAMEFVPGGVTTYPVTISISIDDGDEDSGGAITGSIYINDAVPATVYVDDDFGGAFLDPIADADGGTPVVGATLGFDAFATLTEAVAAVDPAGTIVVNDGDYSAEGIGLTAVAPGVTLQLTGSGGSPGGSTVIIGSLNASPTNVVEIGEEGLVLGNDASTNNIDCPITGTTGTLEKVGTDTLVLGAASTFTGATTVTLGTLQLGDGTLTGTVAGPIVNDSSLVFHPMDTDTVVQSQIISGTGSVTKLGSSTLLMAAAHTYSGGTILGDESNDATNLTQVGLDSVGGPGSVTSGPFGTGILSIYGAGLSSDGAAARTVSNDLFFENGGGNSAYLGDAVNNGTLTFDGPATLTANRGISVASDVDLAGDIGSTVAGAGIVLRGGGRMIHSGSNTYVGATVMENGTLELNGSHTGGGTYTVDPGSRLEGNGSTDSAVDVDGTLSPGGNGVTTLTTGPLTVSGVLEIDVDNTAGAPGAAFDQLVVNGAVTLTGPTLTVFEVGAPEASPAPIVVIDNDTAGDAVTGTFAVGDPFSNDYLGSGRTGAVDYVAGDGNDVALIAYSIIEGWRFANGLPVDGSLDETDTDGDGLVSLLEFGFGTEIGVLDSGPLNPDGSVNGSPTTQLTFGGGVTFDALFIRRDDFGQPGSVSYTVEFSSDLGTFYPSGASPGNVADSTDDPDYHVASVPYPPLLPDGKKARFYRVRVEVVP
ncbi:LamG-like jellyroll fold domain-containing protein [Haloferula helveola]